MRICLIEQLFANRRHKTCGEGHQRNRMWPISCFIAPIEQTDHIKDKIITRLLCTECETGCKACFYDSKENKLCAECDINYALSDDSHLCIRMSLVFKKILQLINVIRFY